jgi:predicted HTH transcriptional regulator
MNAGLLIRVIKEQLKQVPVDELSSVNVKDVLYAEGREADTLDNAPVTTLVTIENKERVELVKDMPIPEKKTHSITINHNTQNIKTVNNISMDIGSRRKRILEIVKARGAVTINEFIEAIKGISSKTIQRELTSLVLSGTLKKTGERRWSKYSLK